MPLTTEQKIFIVEAYFRQKSIRAAHLQFKERFGCREFPVYEAHFLLSGHVNSKNNIFWGRTPPSTVCKGHYTLWSALPGLPSQNMGSLDHSGSRTTTSGLWQSIPSDMSRCLASSGQHLVHGEGSSGSSRMVPPPPTPQKNHWHGYSSASLTDWSSAGVIRSGRRIHRTWTPRFLSVGIP